MSTVAPSEDNHRILVIYSKFSTKKLKPEDRNPFVTGGVHSIDFIEPNAIENLGNQDPCRPFPFQ
jgi:hypothetical protein